MRLLFRWKLTKVLQQLSLLEQFNIYCLSNCLIYKQQCKTKPPEFVFLAGRDNWKWKHDALPHRLPAQEL